MIVLDLPSQSTDDIKVLGLAPLNVPIRFIFFTHLLLNLFCSVFGSEKGSATFDP